MGFLVISASLVRRRSASAPRRPMTIPGRAVCTSIRSRSRVRSISIRLTAARSSWRHQVVADLPVLDEVVLVVAVGEPPGLPVGGHAQAEPVRVDLLAHLLLVSLVSGRLVSGRLVSVGSSSVARRPGRGGLASSPRSRSRRRLVAGRLGGRRSAGTSAGRLRRPPRHLGVAWPRSVRRPRRLRLVRPRRFSGVLGRVGRPRSVPRRAARPRAPPAAGPPWRRSARGRWSPSARRAPATRRARWASCSARRRACWRWSSSIGHAAHDHGDVAGPLADAGGPAPGPGPPALDGGALVGEAGAT